MTGGAAHQVSARGENRIMKLRFRLKAAAFAMGAVALAVLAGCGKSDPGILVDNVRPEVELSAAPGFPTDTTSVVAYSVRLSWFGSDSDGVVTEFEYAVDPPAEGDTAWVSTAASEISILFPSPDPLKLPPGALPPPGQSVRSAEYHTFVVRAVDNEGARSAPVSRSFTSFTVAPSTTIVTPRPNNQQPVSTTPSITISWTGTDPDGVLSQRPVKYKFKLVPASDIDPANPNGVTPGRLQEYFGADAVNFFASWDSVAGDTLSKFYEGLTPQTVYYFAIVAFDEAGAYEPRFNLTSNVLQFRPTLNKLGPIITVFNEFFSRRQSPGGVSLAESRIVKLEFPADAQVTFNWTADPPTGAVITGYRWCVDIEGQDIANETPRVDDDDVNHWSTWSLNETSARIGPFSASTDTASTHYFYLEARDNLGFITLYTIRLTIVKPSFANPLLVIDDMYGTATELAAGQPPGGNIRLLLPYPMEAEADTFYYARGGFEDDFLRRGGFPGVITEPGSFTEFAPDTLDYRHYNVDGMDLQKLSEYRVVAWYTDNTSSSRDGSKFGSNQPSTAIRQINSVNRLNTLAVYLRQGGKAFLFGEGMIPTIVNGYFSRFGNPPAPPYNAGENQRTDVLFPGNFLYDFVHIRSQLTVAGGSNTSLTSNSQLRGAIPFLNRFKGPATNIDRSHDPRIFGYPARGPLPAIGADRTEQNWDDLPLLSLAAYRSANANVALRSFNYTWAITQALQITDNAPNFFPVMDTLYLLQARFYDPNGTQNPRVDGFPNALHYYGNENGPGSELVWFGFPLYIFEKEQARQVVRSVMRNLGVAPAPIAMRGAHSAERGGSLRVVDGGETEDTRRARR